MIFLQRAVISERNTGCVSKSNTRDISERQSCVCMGFFQGVDTILK